MQEGVAQRVTLKPSKSSLWKKIVKHKVYYLFIFPAILCLYFFAYRSYTWLIMVFQDYDLRLGLAGSEFVGFDNFIEIFGTKDFYRALRNTLGINILGFALGFPAPIILALLINEIRNQKLKKTFQVIPYLPHFLSWVVIAGLFYVILDENMGILNKIVIALGGESTAFLRESKYFWIIIVLVTIWKEIGWGSIIYLAALTGIDPALYEASRMDGANKWQQVKHITIPGILPTIALMLILTSGKIAKGGGLIPGFDGLLNMGNPMIYERSETLEVFSYSQGILYNRYSYASAIGMMQSMIAFIFVFGSNFLAKKFKGYGLF